MSRLPEILRRKRKELNLTPEEIAEKIGKSVRAYQYYEQGKEPRHDVMQKLAEVLHFDVSEIYDGNEVDTKVPPLKKIENITEELQDVAKGGEMTAMFLTLIEHLQSMAISLSETREIARENNSLVRTILLNQAKTLPSDQIDGAEKRFHASLEVARKMLRQTFSHT